MASLRTMLLGSIAAAGLWASPASAAVIDGSAFTNGLSAQVIGGISWSAGPAPFTFQQKTLGTPTYTGVGISGSPTGDEIDIGETLGGTSATGLSFTSLTLGVLFDGPEYGDFQEIAQVTITSALAGVLNYTLTSDPVLATWSGPGSVAQLSPPDNVGGAVWQISNPFGAISDITSISFTALPGLCTNAPCSNQSDFTLVQAVTAVPEPATLALFGMGLLGLGWARRRSTGAPQG